LNPSPLINSVVEQASALQTAYYRLLLLVGPSGKGKTKLLHALRDQKNFPYLNINAALSQRLLDYPKPQRPLEVLPILQDVLSEQTSDILLLDNTELLFDPDLRLDPLRCLQFLSRNRSLVVAWNGKYRDGMLTYAEPDHREYRRYEKPDAVITPLEG